MKKRLLKSLLLRENRGKHFPLTFLLPYQLVYLPTSRLDDTSFSLNYTPAHCSYKITSRKLSKVQITKTTVTHTTLPHNEHISEKRFLHLFSRPDWIVSYSQIGNKITFYKPQVKRRERRHNIEDEVDG